MKNLFITLLITFILGCSTNNDVEEYQLESYVHKQIELELVDKINEYRLSKGLNSLVLVEHISYRCQEHNNYMISTGNIGHYFFTERARDIEKCLNAKRVGENLAYNFSSSTSVLNAWLASPGHKVNIEGDYTHMGLSIEVKDGKKYYTNIFAKI